METWFLQLINHWIARSPATFYQALTMSDRMPWLMAAIVITALWYAGERGTVPTAPGKRTRLQNRTLVILTLASLMVGFILAKGLQGFWQRPRPLNDFPLQVPIEPSVWEAVRQSFFAVDSFPSDHAVMLFVLATGVIYVNKRMGLIVLVASIYFALLRIGLGFHWPLDIWAGACIGVLVMSVAILLEPIVHRLLFSLVLQFEYYPQVMYALAFLVVFELWRKFEDLFVLVSRVSG
ncbi:MAG: phosphatase PAP2 family protein [Chloroflexi bacterium]|nr:MAG: phosphatase PAP2 family protein [Chloroflexota bacterium]